MILEKDNLRIEVTEHGAELVSLQKGGREYLWGGDAAYWNRHSPILFPVVGKPYNNELHIGGRIYPMKQHGFARDSEFDLIRSDNWLVYSMKDAYHPEVYPYNYGLEVAYLIHGSTLTVSWLIENLGDDVMYFQIGAHPAFLLPDYDPQDAIHGYVQFFDREGKAIQPRQTHGLEDGNRVPIAGVRMLPDKLPLANDTFASDALMIEDRQVTKTALLDKQGRKVLEVECEDADAYGIWAPHKKDCPFVCLEPWRGICDRKGFNGDISQRDIIHSIYPGGHDHFEYTITLL